MTGYQQPSRHTDEIEEGTFQTGEDSLPYIIGLDCQDVIEERLRTQVRGGIVLIADEVAFLHHGAALLDNLRRFAQVDVVTVVADESMKTLPVVYEVLERLVQSGADRQTTIISFGGGLTANLAGLVAGMLYRGVNLVHLPTTFMCIADGVLSRKQAVNGIGGKNQYGLFHSPIGIYCDVRWLSSQSRTAITSGMVELAKNALTFDDKMLGIILRQQELRLEPADLMEWAVIAVRSKERVMRNDPTECHEGLLLEYGHTVGHALELSQVGLAHGHAVALGMRVAGQIAAGRGLMDPEQLRRHDELIDRVEGCSHPPAAVGMEYLCRLLKSDNKRGRIACQEDEVAMILLAGIGRPVRTGTLPLVPVRLSEVVEAILALGWEQPVRAAAIGSPT